MSTEQQAADIARRILPREADAAAALIANVGDILAGDETAISDAIEGETNLIELVITIDARLQTLDAMIATLDELTKQQRERQGRLKKQREFLRTAVGSAMDHAGLKKIETGIGTISVRAVPPSAIITDESALPAVFLRTKVEADKAKITAALKEGDDVPGAQLSNGGQTISIRRT